MSIGKPNQCEWTPAVMQLFERAERTIVFLRGCSFELKFYADRDTMSDFLGKNRVVGNDDWRDRDEEQYHGRTTRIESD